MAIKINIFLTGALLITLMALGQVQRAPLVIKGQVIANATGQPVTNAHVFIIDGEEEALTDHKGEFAIESWQKAPVKLTVNAYRGYSQTSIVVTNPAQKQVIRLKTQSR